MILGIFTVCFIALIPVTIFLIAKTTIKNFAPQSVNGYRVSFSNSINTSFGSFAGASIGIPFRMPSLLMDSKQNNRLLYASLGTKSGNNFKVVLEGDFNDYFDVYVREGNQNFALILLSPDVMEKFKQLDNYDVLIEGKSIFILMNDTTILDQSNYNNLLQVAAVITSELKPKMERWQALNTFGENVKKQIRQ